MAITKTTYINTELEITWECANFSGIYMILNIINNKFYIGSSTDIYKRMNAHINDLRKGIHTNLHLQNSFNKYKEQVFKFYLIKLIKGTAEELVIAEQYYIDLLKPNYNINPIASSRLGSKLTPEQIDEHSRSRYKKVCQYDSKGKLLNTFESLIAAQKFFGTEKSGYLTDHLKGINRTYKGYFWAYEGCSPTIRKSRTGMRSIVAEDIFGNITTYDSIKDAAKLLNMHRISIAECLGNTSKNKN